MALILGESKAAIVLWGLAFCATVLVTVFAQTVGQREERRPFVGRLLVNCVIVVFCCFLLLTITAFLNLGPSAWADVLGINDKKIEPFQQPGNGPVSFGCEAGSAATVQLVAPDGMHIRNVTVEPVDVHAAKSVTASILSNDGKTAKGKVDYFGQDRDLVRNCHGGGHGAAIMKGDFERDAPRFLGLLSTVLGIALIVALLTFFGSLPPRRPDRAPQRA